MHLLNKPYEVKLTKPSVSGCLQRALSVSVHFSGADSALLIAFQNILPGLVVEVAVIVGDHSIDQGSIDLHQIFQNLLFPAVKEILNQSLIYLADGPVVRYREIVAHQPIFCQDEWQPF